MKSIFQATYFYNATLLAASVAALVGAALFSTAVQAQSSCSSDGQAAPTALLERFISADCSDCWAASSLPVATKGQASLDWIVPSPRGDDAPLSAAASNEASARLAELKLTWNASSGTAQSSALLPAPQGKQQPKQQINTVRVAHGLPYNGYIGASIEFTPSQMLKSDALTLKKLSTINSPEKYEANAYLVLIETIPAGTEGSKIERNLVRNLVVTPWDVGQQLLRDKSTGFKPFFESRPVSIPQGVNPDRLRVLGWVQDAQGKVLAMTQSRCKP
jgi:hypothetical protein